MLSFDWKAMLNVLEGQEAPFGVLLVGLGLVFILLGVRAFRVLVAVSFGAVGFALGASLPLDAGGRMAAALVGAVGLGMASSQQLKIAVGLLAGGWVAGLWLMAMSAFGLRQDVTVVSAVVLFIAAVSMSVVFYQEIIAIVLSFEGSIMLVGGLVVLLSRDASLWPPIRSLLLEMPWFGPFVLLAGTVTGFYLQVAEMQKKQVGTSG